MYPSISASVVPPMRDPHGFRPTAAASAGAQTGSASGAFGTAYTHPRSFLPTGGAPLASLLTNQDADSRLLPPKEANTAAPYAAAEAKVEAFTPAWAERARADTHQELKQSATALVIAAVAAGACVVVAAAIQST